MRFWRLPTFFTYISVQILRLCIQVFSLKQGILCRDRLESRRNTNVYFPLTLLSSYGVEGKIFEKAPSRWRLVTTLTSLLLRLLDSVCTRDPLISRSNWTTSMAWIWTTDIGKDSSLIDTFISVLRVKQQYSSRSEEILAPSGYF